jgi:HK97 family phage portal protein
MPFLDRLRGALRAPTPRPESADETKASAARRLFALSVAGRPQWTPADFGALARQGFAKNPVAYRCVRMLSESAASVPLVCHLDGRRATDHPLQRLIDRPNPEMSAPDLFEAFFGALQTAGNGYLEAAGEAVAQGGAPTELYALRPDRVRVVPGPDGWPIAWTYDADGTVATLKRRGDGFAPVLHLKLLNPTDDHYGLSPLQAAGRAVDVHNASSDWNKALLDNAARPSGALVYAPGAGERLTEAQFERLKAELIDLHTGAAAAGRPLLLEGGLDWKPMALTPQEMDFAEGKHAAAREIALAFGVPPQLLGIPGDNTYSNYKEANAAFWRTAVAPLAERGARALSAWLGPLFDGAVLRCDFDQAPALAAERTELWARLDAATFLTPEEKRRMAGLGVAGDAAP